MNGRVFKILIVGGGNIGLSVLAMLPSFPDLECVGIVSRDPARVAEKVKDILIFDLNGDEWQTVEADAAILCGGSKDDLWIQGPLFARFFNTVDSFDTHGKIDHFEEGGVQKQGYFHLMDEVALMYQRTALVCQGWDPGIFSEMRSMFGDVLGEAKVVAFYGLTDKGGRSMGHSNALLTVDGVLAGVSITHAKREAIDFIRSGGDATVLKPGDMHWRENFIVVAEGADCDEIERKIVTMRDYFEPYETTVNIVSQEILDRNYSGMQHDGLVICRTDSGLMMEFRVEFESNPLATAGILLAHARTAVRFNEDGAYGAYTSLHVPRIALKRDPESFLSLI